MISEDQLPPGVDARGVLRRQRPARELREQLASGLSAAAGFLEGDRVHPDRAGSDASARRRSGRTGRPGRWPRCLTWEPTARCGSSSVRVAVVVVSVFAPGGRPCSPCSAVALSGRRGTARDRRWTPDGPWFAGRRLAPCSRIAAGLSASARWLGVTLAMVGRNTAAAARRRVRLSRDRGEPLARIHPEDLRLAAQHQPRGIRRRQGRHVRRPGSAIAGRRSAFDHDRDLCSRSCSLIALALFRTRDVT